MNKVIEVESPIINSPFEEPRLHWVVTRGELPHKAPERRQAYYYYRVPERAARGRKTKAERELFAETQVGEAEPLDLVNLLRERVAAWREGRTSGRAYDGASPVTRELLELWRAGAARAAAVLRPDRGGGDRAVPHRGGCGLPQGSAGNSQRRAKPAGAGGRCPRLCPIRLQRWLPAPARPR